MSTKRRSMKRVIGVVEYAIGAPTLEDCKVILCDILSGLPIYGADDLHMRDRPEWQVAAKKFRVIQD